MTELLANNAQSTLMFSIDADALELTVVDASSFPDTGDFRLIIGSEYLLATAVSGATFTVTRHIEGSTVASHAAGALVTHELTVGGLTQFVLDNATGGGGSGELSFGPYVNRDISGLGNLGAAPELVPTDPTKATLWMATFINPGNATSYCTIGSNLGHQSSAAYIDGGTGNLLPLWILLAPGESAYVEVDGGTAFLAGIYERTVSGGGGAGGTGGAVDSVNGLTGTVVLDATDVGADAAGAAAAAQAASQPLDSDLTAIAALTTTAFGRALLALADAAAGQAAFGLGTAATAASTDFDASGAAAAAQAASQPLDADLTAIAALSTTTYGRSLLALADATAARTALALGTAATHPSTDFDSAGAAAAAQAASQPLDSDLTAIAALATTSYGRAFLALADAAAGRTALGLGTAATSASTDFQPVDSDLTAIAALTTTSYGRSFLALADAAAGRTALGLGTAAVSAITDFDAAGAAAAAQAASQPLDSDLTSIAALSTTTFGRSLLTQANAAAALATIGAAAASHTHAESDVTNLVSDLAARTLALTRTAVKTANYTAAANESVPCDTTSGSFTVTLPNAPADKTRNLVKQILRGATNTVTVACAGSDTINRTGGVTSLTLTLLAESALLQYDSGSATWTIQANDAPLSQLDARYQSTSTRLAELAALNTNSTVPEQVGGVWVARSMASLKTDLALVKGDVGLGNVDNTADTAKTFTHSQISDMQFAALTANLTALSASTTLTDVTGLGLTIGASSTEIWLVKFWLLYSAANATMDAKFGFSVPASATMRWGPIASSGTFAGGWSPIGTAGSVVGALTESGTISVGTSAITHHTALTAIVFGGGTGGTVQIRYAQATSDAGNLQMLKGSVMEATKVAA